MPNLVSRLLLLSPGTWGGGSGCAGGVWGLVVCSTGKKGATGMHLNLYNIDYCIQDSV